MMCFSHPLIYAFTNHCNSLLLLPVSAVTCTLLLLLFTFENGLSAFDNLTAIIL